MNAGVVQRAGSFRQTVLPWSVAAADERRFQRILRGTLALALLLAVGVARLPRQPTVHAEFPPLPPPMARLLLPPVPPLPAPAEPAADPAGPRPPSPAAPAPARRVQPPAREAPSPATTRLAAEAAVERARRKAGSVGLLAMRQELAALTGAPPAVPPRDVAPAAGSGDSRAPRIEPGSTARAMVTASATRGSGGIETATRSREAGGADLAGRTTTRLAGTAGHGSAGGSPAGVAAPGAGGTAAAAGHAKPGRPLEDIKLVFERNKGAIYALYDRALRDDPSLQGKLVLELTIAPSGRVTALRIVSSDLHATELERRLLARIGLFDFGARDVERIVVTWPLDFLPS